MLPRDLTPVKCEFGSPGPNFTALPHPHSGPWTVTVATGAFPTADSALQSRVTPGSPEAPRRTRGEFRMCSFQRKWTAAESTPWGLHLYLGQGGKKRKMCYDVRNTPAENL